MATEKKAPSKRELIEPNKGDKRYVRRKADGTFGKTVDVGKSLETKVPKGQRDRGDVLALAVGIGSAWPSNSG